MSQPEPSHGPVVAPQGRRVRYVPVVGPRLKRLLAVVLALFALMTVNSVYLVSITVAGPQYQNWFYLWMFLVHLAMGLALVVPVVVFGAIHIRNARNRPNRRAIRAGFALFVTAILVLVSGLVLVRVDLFGFRLELNQQLARSIVYWVHVVGPLAAVWLFVLHRLAGRRIRWRVGISWAGVAALFALVMVLLHRHDPRAWNVAGPRSGQQYFFPSLTRTATGNFIPARVLQNDQYCLQCHPDIHESWSRSVHRFASFNNPAYLASVRETRRKLMQRDGNVHGSRFCAGCHDPVPFFSGAFEDPRFDDPEYDLASDPMAQAGVSCSVCHAIAHVNSVRGNADYTIGEPVHYPFAFSDNAFLQWLNRQLIKAKPAFHKAEFLKPLHQSTEFCGSCHKVHLPEELNDYKFLRGQNHFDSFWLSGVSGYGIESFYYPPRAEANCNGCHMPLRPSRDFAARAFERDPSKPLFGELAVHDHMFPSANTAMASLVGMPDAAEVVEAHREFLKGVMRVDVFGLRAGGRIDGALQAPLGEVVPALEPGATYLLETVIRTVKMGHHFTQGTADSNEVWLDVTVRSGDRVIGRSGGMDPADGSVDPWSHFVNAFVLDRDGNRIDRRNAEDIFVALYDHQIPPGAADVVHHRLVLPPDITEPVTVEVRLLYRKFDTTYMRFVHGEEFTTNGLPITTLATDSFTFPVGGATVAPRESPVPAWQRWNDFGIGLLRREGRGELRGAEEAFLQVEALGRADGPLNLARVYLREGRVAEDAVAALRRAADPGRFAEPAPAWSILWFSGQVSKQNGRLEEAIQDYRQILEGGFAQAAGRGFDFSKDYRLLNELAATHYLAAKQERGVEAAARRAGHLEEAERWYQAAVSLDPENVAAHYGLKQVYTELGRVDLAQKHEALHGTYRIDDNARDRAVAAARSRYPAANHAAEAVVIYDLQRPGAFGLPESEIRVAADDRRTATDPPDHGHQRP